MGGPRTQGHHNNKYKTRMCVHTENRKICPYGFKCQFAHNEEERIRWHQYRSNYIETEDEFLTEDMTPYDGYMRTKMAFATGGGLHWIPCQDELI